MSSQEDPSLTLAYRGAEEKEGDKLFVDFGKVKEKPA